MYCPKCLHLTDETRCPCGNARLRASQPEDLVYLVQCDSLWVSALGELLRDHGIPHTERSVTGAAIAAYTGSWLEKRNFYVRFDQYEQAKALAEDFFAPGDDAQG